MPPDLTPEEIAKRCELHPMLLALLRDVIEYSADPHLAGRARKALELAGKPT